jgi:hypothetical protein
MMRFRFSSAGAIERISRRLLLVFLFCAVIVEANGQNTRATPSAQNHPVMVTRLYTGADGQSHIDRVPIMFHGAPDEASAAVKTSDAYLARGAPGMFETWHNADRKRYIVVISGEAEVTTTDGEKLRLVPGEIYLAEDLTGKGHTFRVIGNQEWVALFVDFAQ